MKVEFYFDFLSPFSYLAWKWVYSKKDLYDFVIRPVVMGKVIHFHETKGPAEIESKRNYLMKFCLRFAAKNNIAFKTPLSIPFNSIPFLRMAIASEQKFDFINDVYDGIWQAKADFDNPESFLPYLKECGHEVDSLWEKGSAREAKKELKQNIKTAQELSLFGVPTFIVNDEMFWGNDSIEDLENFLAGTDQFDQGEFQKFIEKFPQS